MRQEEIDSLIEKYLHDTASPEERKRLLEWYQAQNPLVVEWNSSENEEVLRSRVYGEIQNKINQEQPKTSNNTIYYRIAAAAVVLMVLSLSLVSHLTNRKTNLKTVKVKLNEQILLKGERATLTLSDGTKIILDSAKNSVLGQQAGVIIRKTADGQLTYTISSSQRSMSRNTGTQGEIYNTIETPPGGGYNLSLPDGSKVYLNSSSILRFPISFTKNDRKVQLNGEAYFEVAQDRARPFKVESTDQIVEVLGTHFNVNSYKNEPVIKTTLVEGRVKVSKRNTGESKFLKPGQEANLEKNGRITVAPADTEQALGWKSGSFVFNDLQLIDIMRQLERWYNVSVDYSTIPETRYNGVISRKVPLSKALQMLEVTGGVKFTVVGRTIRIIK